MVCICVIATVKATVMATVIAAVMTTVIATAIASVIATDMTGLFSVCIMQIASWRLLQDTVHVVQGRHKLLPASMFRKYGCSCHALLRTSKVVTGIHDL